MWFVEKPSDVQVRPQTRRVLKNTGKYLGDLKDDNDVVAGQKSGNRVFCFHSLSDNSLKRTQETDGMETTARVSSNIHVDGLTCVLGENMMSRIACKLKDRSTSCAAYAERGGNRTRQGARRGGRGRERMKRGRQMKGHELGREG
jgi:hypothetical protein